jgi:hypothetical protein
VSPGTGDTTTNKNPSIYFKAGYDKKFSKDFRFRITGSGYLNDASGRNTLFGGDRTGSNYFFVMESQAANYSASATSAAAMKPTTTAQFTSGRFNPGFSRSVQAFQFNSLITYRPMDFLGLELFLNYDMATGRSQSEKEDRSMSQIAADLIFRLGNNDECYVAGRFNSADLEVAGQVDANSAQLKQNIQRIAVAGGWFLTRNILLKVAYVTQSYNDFNANNILNGGTFSGVVLGAVVGF